MKKINFKLILMLIALLAVLFLCLNFSHSNTVEQGFIGSDLSLADRITCTYPLILSVKYQNDTISHILPKKESNPVIFTFSDLKKDVANLSYIDATQTITNVKIVKLVDSPDRYIFMEGGAENYFTTHTIFKDKAVSVYNKSVDIIGTPAGSLSMGNCVGY